MQIAKCCLFQGISTSKSVFFYWLVVDQFSIQSRWTNESTETINADSVVENMNTAAFIVKVASLFSIWFTTISCTFSISSSSGRAFLNTVGCWNNMHQKHLKFHTFLHSSVDKFAINLYYWAAVVKNGNPELSYVLLRPNTWFQVSVAPIEVIKLF